MRLVLLFVACVGFPIVVLLFTTGCQLDVSAAAGGKVFHPDYDQGKKVGDPRKPMYGGSGYGERHTAGSETGSSGFGGMNRKGEE